MAEAKPTTNTVLTLKLLVDTKAQRVLYAEAGKDVVDFLFSLLAFPLGAVAKLLTPSAMVGSIGSLYGSVEKIDAAGYVGRRDATDALLASPVFQLAAQDSTSGCLYRCKGCSCSKSCYGYVTRVSATPCPVCKSEMTTELQLVEPDDDDTAKDVVGKKAASSQTSASLVEAGGKGYVRDMVTYTVMDDLAVAPLSSVSAIAAFVTLGVTDITGLQEKIVEIGYKEGLAMMKASLQSKTVLTDVFLGAKNSA